MTTKRALWLGLLCGISTVVVMTVDSPSAGADANTFLAYVHGHGVNTGLAPDSKILHAGMFACDSLHAGQTPDQIVGGVTFSWMDVRGIIDAAQHELCPDTIR
jgi:hypothetical protein